MAHGSRRAHGRLRHCRPLASASLAQLAFKGAERLTGAPGQTWGDSGPLRKARPAFPIPPVPEMSVIAT